MIVGSSNDSLSKYLSADLNYVTIGFFMFLLESVLLLPYVFRQSGPVCFKRKNLLVHMVRGGILALGIYLYIYALHGKNMTVVTLIGFAKPILILILAKFLLQEQVIWTTWLLVIVTFISILLLLKIDNLAYNLPIFCCLLANVLFAWLEILNKKYVHCESTVNMLFFSAFFAMLWMLIFGWSAITMPDFYQWVLLILLAISGNVFLLCILEAFKLSDASLLAPFSYLGFAISSLFGYLFFHELPDIRACIGVAMLIPTSCFTYWYHHRHR